MNKHYVRVTCNVACKYEGLAPVYRVYVNDQLFTERTWIWQDEFYLTEQIQIEAPAGEYQLRYELVPPNLADLRVSLPIITHGPATIDATGCIRITDETA